MLSKMCSNNTEQEEVNFSNDTFNPAAITVTPQVNNFNSQRTSGMNTSTDFKVTFLITNFTYEH